MTLLPSGLPIRAVAKVISCEQLLTAQNGKALSVRLAFTHMNETDRNILVKHTLTRQAENLRSKNNKVKFLPRSLDALYWDSLSGVIC